MRKLAYLFLAVLLSGILTTACKKKTTVSPDNGADSICEGVSDTTVYGICGEGTTMHNLELITNDGDTLNLSVNVDDSDTDVVKGGLLCGDKLAVIVTDIYGEKTAGIVVNLTTLEGKWTSLDRNFEIVDGGEVLSTVQSETNPYTSWKIHNGKLLMGRDSFDVVSLGADSLELENSKGIFVYKRQKQISSQNRK
ncbi:MAG: lipocalin family protein [Prevotella sp.]|nr:lipocalin family protein [Prevotella sp.]MDE6150942.1 lipocalin family protein [Prevotella sp.]